jgi:uncharacterized cupredoxin-like copper-binding protein
LKRRRLLQATAACCLPAGISLAWGHGGSAHTPGQDATAIDRTQHDWGRGGDPREASRHLRIAMSDRMRFTPDRLRVRLGETLRLTVRNRGRLMHELVIGTREELERHAELMKRHPGMEHAEPYMVHVAPGRQAELTWHFNRPGRFIYGCLVAGHWDAGMLGQIQVED